MIIVLRNLFIFTITSTVLFSCSTVTSPVLPKNSGSYGEILCVADQALWNTSIADKLRETMSLPLYGLPQPEPMFDVVELKSYGFKDMYKTHRNVLKIEVDPKHEPKVQVLKNVNARQQVYIVIQVPDFKALDELIDERMTQILWIFHNEEVARIEERNKDFGSKDFNKRVAELTAVYMQNQDQFQIATTEERFTWLRLDREKPVGGYQHQMNQGLLVYQRPYTDTMNFADSNLYAWMNKTSRKHVTGPKDSKMVISDKFILPESKVIEHEGMYAKEIRGLWRMDGYFMGGPFYAMTFVHPESNMQYLIQGFVYAPQFNKRFMLREMEAIVKSARPVAMASAEGN